MKKIFLFVITISIIFLLTGCNVYSAKSYNELEFDEELTVSEKAKVIANITEKMIDFSKVTIKSIDIKNNNKYKQKVKEEHKIKMYKNDLMYMTSKYTRIIKQDGEKDKEEGTLISGSLGLKDSNEILTFSNVYQEGDKLYFDKRSGDFSSVYLTAFDIIQGKTTTLSSLNAYKSKRYAYVFVYSKVIENRSVDNEKRQKFEVQTIYLIDKNYKIKKVLVYQASTTNVDPEDGKFYKKDKIVTMLSITIKVEYGIKTSNKRLENEILKKYKSTKI